MRARHPPGNRNRSRRHQDTPLDEGIQDAPKELPRELGLSPALDVHVTLVFSNTIRGTRPQETWVDTLYSGTRVMVVIPNALSSAPPIDLDRLFGTMMISLAAIGMSTFLPLITAP